ncbi:hypothetical protein LO762_21550 [Actinocorallia sp. API 0066]|uniref:hypothetical protein n=1 Tax=Actinocorallia sp. API 0066 TaxID=2896846 RepID=UPI001E5C35A2|nr:hypothetical protein [Actinocorallia sp. API 0066]MCD0451759.1 hypothetical protein [Actinocorallia sp. API 0066]
MTEPRVLAPITVGALRSYLAEQGLADHLPVVVGGTDFDDAERTLIGIADDLRHDALGPFGGRLVIAATGLGLVDEG